MGPILSFKRRQERNFNTRPENSKRRRRRNSIDTWSKNSKQREKRNFADIWPYLGNALFKSAVKKIIIQPMLGGARRMIPSRIFHTYYNLSQKFSDRKLYQNI